MQIRSASLAAIALAAFVPFARAQVLAPAEIQDPTIRGLQQSHLDDLHAITMVLAGHRYPYPFYFSRRLDLPEREQKSSDQRSIQFDRFQGQLVLKITGNYFAAYSAERMSREERASRTCQDVMIPILMAAVPVLAKADVPDAFALEISHHVIRSVLGVETEGAENVVLILPKAAARAMVEARDDAGRTAAILKGAAYLNGVPVSLWPGEVKENPVVKVSANSAPAAVPGKAPVATKAPVAEKSTTKAPPKQDAEYRDTIAKMLKEIDAQAHFVAYAPPSFIDFRGGQYLQLPIATTLEASDKGSQYTLAALAFDRHIAHLIRPVIGYFKESEDFTGIDFSTTVRRAGASGEDEGNEAVEFVFPLSAMRAYAQYNLTGQQLLDSGVVLINGERAGLDLQTAEGHAVSE